MALVFIELILLLLLYPHEQALLVLVRDDVADAGGRYKRILTPLILASISRLCVEFYSFLPLQGPSLVSKVFLRAPHTLGTDGPVLRVLVFRPFHTNSRCGRKTWRWDSPPPSALLIRWHSCRVCRHQTRVGAVSSSAQNAVSGGCEPAWTLGPLACAAGLQLTDLRLQSEMAKARVRPGGSAVLYSAGNLFGTLRQKS